MIKRFINWLRRDSEYDKRLKEYSRRHTEFVNSLTPRQLEYWKSQEDVRLEWSLIDLENRIYKLENKND